VDNNLPSDWSHEDLKDIAGLFAKIKEFYTAQPTVMKTLSKEFKSYLELVRASLS